MWHLHWSHPAEPSLGIEPSPLPYQGSAPPWSYDGKYRWLRGSLPSVTARGIRASRWRCRELNPQGLLARQNRVPTHIPVVEPAGIEPAFRDCQPRVLPLDDSPVTFTSAGACSRSDELAVLLSELL